MRGASNISCILPESVRTVLTFFPVSEGRVSRSNFGSTGILFWHDKNIRVRIISDEIAVKNLNFDEGLFIAAG
jgi:hypothetical protein